MGRRTLKFLTVGNSFSRDACEYLPALASAGGGAVVLGEAELSGCSLEQHVGNLRQAESDPSSARVYSRFVDPNTGDGKPATLPDALAATGWDVVTIQQSSPLSFLPESYHPHAARLIAAIRRYVPRSEIVIHQTWAYREDSPLFKGSTDFNQAKMYAQLRDAYRHLADSNGFRLIPTGDAFQRARATARWRHVPDSDFDYDCPTEGALPDQRASLNIGWYWHTDLQTGAKSFTLDAKHCNAAGKYLAACVWYATLFGTDTIPDSYVPPDVGKRDAVELRAHAVAAVEAERTRTAKGAPE